MKFLVKYWAQITGILMALAMIFGWLWHMKTQLDNYLNVQTDLARRMQIVEAQSDEHDQNVDDLDHRLIPLEVKENLREKNLLK